MGLGAFPAPHEQWLGHARHARHARGQLRDGRGRPDLRDRRPLRRPHHRQAVGVRAAARSSSTSTSTRPRSPRTSRRTSRSSATPSTSLAKLIVEYRALERRPGAARRSGGSASTAGRRSTRCATRTRADAEIKPQYMVQALYEATGGDAIVTSDVGQHQMWAAQYYDFAARAAGSTRAASARWASACRPRWAPQVGCPDELVVCIAGDGSVQMNVQELATCAQDEIPIKVFIMNNGYLGMVRQWQELFWDGATATSTWASSPTSSSSPRPTARPACASRTRRTLVEDLRAAIATDGPVLVDVRVTREENTYPMIPRRPGRARHGGLSHGRAGNQGAAQPRGARGVRRACARAASTCSRSSSRTSRAC